MQGLGTTKNHLRSVLRYTDELLSFNEKVVFDLAKEPYPHFHEHQVAGLEGVELGPDGEIWLRIRRLRETPPPECDAIFAGWVDFGRHPLPDKPPDLLAERLLKDLLIEDISELAEAGLLIDEADVLRPIDADTRMVERMDVILRTANMPEFVALWQDYRDGPWAQWAERELPRRRAIEFYNKLYQIHQRIIALGDDTPMELVFGVGVARWLIEGHRINAPLIEQFVEMELEENGALIVRSRNLPPQLALKPFHALAIEGSKAVQRDMGVLLERLFEDPDVGFSPFDKRSFEKVLRGCAARLSAKGDYHPDTLADPGDRSLPTADEILRISDTWVLYVRQRSGDFRRDDIARLIRRVEESEDEDQLPAPAVRFVTEPADEVIDPGAEAIDLRNPTLILPPEAPGPRLPIGGDGNNGSPQPAERAETFFFPLPYNDDQQEIIRRLEARESVGVVVQGPPGTGKTHTIANIICHFLATRRRVLVTAKTPEALRALQEKIPEGIRDLAISVIHNDREGARQLQHAVQILADEAKSIDDRRVGQEIAEKQARLIQLRDDIAAIDAQIYRLAQRNLARLTCHGQEVSPMELARRVRDERDRHRWFPDELTLEAHHEPQFGDAEIAEARTLRRLLSRDFAYDIDTLPDPGLLPELARVVAAHGELARVREIETAAEGGALAYMIPDLGKARRLHEWIAGFDGFMREADQERWLVAAHHALLGVKALDPEPLRALQEALAIWAELYRRGREFDLKGIVCYPQDDPALDKALADLAAGRNPFGLFSLFKGGLKAKIDLCRFEGRHPAAAEEWLTVGRYREWQREAQRFAGRWSGLAHALDFPPFPAEWDLACGEFLRLGRLVERLCDIHDQIEIPRQLIRALFPYGIDAGAVLQHGCCASLIAALAANLEKAALAGAADLARDLARFADRGALPFHASLRDFCAGLGDREVPPGAIAVSWQDILAEARRLNSLADRFHRLHQIVEKIAQSGAPEWAQQLRSTPVAGEDDPWTPADWRAAWEWARANGYLRTLGDRQVPSELAARRATAEAEQRRLLAEIVRLRTFLGMKQALTPKISSALARYTAAVSRLGKGMGKSAGRYRRIIRDAALDAARAVPCWILPEWRVAEQLPAELASFDLVIVDEASQSDITALPALFRGRKVLIVGDDKQVSPTPIGIEDRKTVQLRTTFLAGLPFADQMDPATSLYELAGMVYPGRAIVLREHFRCVEPIIAFSSRFYPQPLIPLRLPTTSERLDPPLVDIYMPFGRKIRDINAAEIDVIVAEIAKIVADPAFAERSIGVISLIGHAQANRIYTRLIAELGTETLERHRIMCGNAATFQGQERDIVFLSMVACPETAVAQTARIYEQRFNVAASRARDRLVLVRSVAASDLNPGDLKLKLIEHFQDPLKGAGLIRPQQVLEPCQSDFERDFGRVLLERGYRIRPQVKVGAFSIDFVIEGAEDRRLAVELDGDQYHGPDKWADDLRRQRALERVGWVFWRCWGSAWERDREACLADLERTLARLGIAPLGLGAIDGAFTQHIEVPAPAADAVMPLPGATAVPGLGRRRDAGAETVFADLNERAAETGDLVVLRCDDQPQRRVSLRLSEAIDKPDEGILDIRTPSGSALLGAVVDDQVEIAVGGKRRTATIEKIEKAPQTGGLAAE
jgi:very-short-patch-repair endonuclease